VSSRRSGADSCRRRTMHPVSTPSR
jgi:hypothetical protein